MSRFSGCTVLFVLLLFLQSARAQINWQATSGPIFNDRKGVIMLDTSPNGDLIAAGAYGIAVSSDGGEQWIISSIGSQNDSARYSYRMVADYPEMPPYTGPPIVRRSQSEMLIAMDRGIYRSTDNGRSWHPFAFQGVHVAAMARRPDGVMLAVVRDAARLYRSTDDGLTWDPLGSEIGFITMHATPKGAFLADTYYEAWRSTDNGDTWTMVCDNEWRATGCSIVSRNGDMVRSTSSWINDVSRPWEPEILYSGNIFRSTDDGLTWISLTEKLRSSNLIAVRTFCDAPNGSVYVAMQYGGWFEIPSDIDSFPQERMYSQMLPFAPYAIIVGPGNRFYAAASGDVVYRSDRPYISAAPDTPERSASSPTLTLSPQPVRSAATVRFSLPVSGTISLNLVDLLGREVARIASGEFSSGEHTIAWEPAGLPAGVYCCYLRSENGTICDKIIINSE